jgi:hypothetical protein
MEGFDIFNGNVIRGHDRAIVNGVQIICEERSDFLHLNSFKANIIEGCFEAGLYVSADGWSTETNHPEVAIFGFERNVIRENGGSGIVFQWDSDEADAGAGYLHLIGARGNLVADNDDFGVAFVGLGDDSTGSFDFTNDTIVYNGLGAEGFLLADDSDAILPVHANCIVYGNGGTAQTYGLGLTVLSELLANVTYSDWQGITCGTGNISSDPKFVNVSTRDYHLDDDPLSPCVDAGSNDAVPEGLIFDFDRDDRIQDGVCPISGTALVDMGCDELPEPNCEP